MFNQIIAKLEAKRNKQAIQEQTARDMRDNMRLDLLSEMLALQNMNLKHRSKSLRQASSIRLTNIHNLLEQLGVIFPNHEQI